MKIVLPVIPGPHRFTSKDFVGGDAALDFVNTVAGRDRSPRDRLDSYQRLLEWAEAAQLLPAKTLQAMARKAQREPEAAAEALARAQCLREAIFELVTALIANRAPTKAALTLLREQWIAAIEAHKLRFVDGRVVAIPREGASNLDLIAAVITSRVIQHVLPAPPDRLRMCQGEDCSWLFIDSSKAGRRCWCDMAVCGNTAKSRRFQLRRKAR